MIEIESNLKERDADVRAGGKAFHAFCMKQGYGKDPKTEEIRLHRLRSAITTMPDEMRKASRQWLTERGYQPWD